MKHETSLKDRVGISVIIPCYNASATIVIALESVVNQSYQPMELIVINDGSSDDSYQVITNWISGKILPFPYQIIDQENGGPSKARNRGIGIAKGEYVAFLDADDYWLPNHLENACNVLSINRGYATIISSAPLLPSSPCIGLMADKHIYNGLTLLRMIFFQRGFCTPSIVVPRSMLIDVGMFPEDRRYAEDLELFLKLRLRCGRWLSIVSPQSVVCGKHLWSSGKGLSSQHWPMYLGTLKAAYKALRFSRYSVLIPFLWLWFSLKYIRRLVIIGIKNSANMIITFEWRGVKKVFFSKYL